MALAREALAAGDARALIRCMGIVARASGSGGGGGRQQTRLKALRIDEEPLYDRISFGSDYEHRFFRSGIGNYDPTERSAATLEPKTIAWTNLLLSGALPEPETFEITGISFCVREDAPRAFVTWLRHETVFDIRMSGMQVTAHREPTWRVVRRGNVDDALEDWDEVPAPILPFGHSILIAKNENFAVIVTSPGERWTGTPQRVRCILHGWHGKSRGDY